MTGSDEGSDKESRRRKKSKRWQTLDLHAAGPANLISSIGTIADLALWVVR
jgi:hypothetical protein